MIKIAINHNATYFENLYHDFTIFIFQQLLKKKLRDILDGTKFGANISYDENKPLGTAGSLYH